MSKLTSILLLSGGKDSCALAVKMKEAGIKYLAVTIDNSILSDVARKNILKLTQALDIEHIIFRPPATVYKGIIDKGMDMEKTCSACSASTLLFARMIADFFNVKVIYAGYTKYTAQAQGWDQSPEKEIDGYMMVYPFMDKYDLKEIREICAKYGLEIDPTKTNCKCINKIIDRSTDNPFTREIDLLLKDGQISQAEYDYYRAFTEPKSRAKAGSKKRGPGVPTGADSKVPV